MIDNLTLLNFKAFQHLDLGFAPLTLLSGVNSVGKSTVLQALGLLRQSYLNGGLEEGFLLNDEYVQLGSGQDVLHEDYDSTLGGPVLGISIAEGPRRISWTASYDADADVLPFRASVETPGDLLERMGPFSSHFQYLRADRSGPIVLHPRSAKLAQREGFLGCEGQYTVNYLREHGDEELDNTAVLHPRAASGQLLDQVNAWLGEISPGINAQTESISGTDLIRLDFGYFGTAGLSSTNRYRPTNVGFGLSYVLPVITALLAAPDGAMIILENPEAHLHPHGQSVIGRLVSLVAREECRVLVETHSDHLLNGIRLAVKDELLESDRVALHYFSRDVSGVSRVESPALEPSGRLTSWPVGFFDEAEVSLSRLLG